MLPDAGVEGAFVTRQIRLKSGVRFVELVLEGVVAGCCVVVVGETATAVDDSGFPALDD